MTATTEELFSSALSLPVSERENFLDRACGSDAPRKAELCGLLEALPASSRFVRDSSRALMPAGIDETIDNYRLTQELGQGGCGIVYLAEQLGPIKREVALKIIKLGMDTRAVINRFEAERQALAMMDHPNIAKVFVAGATPVGRSYFVMELVRGIRITDYCNQCRLTVEERLELFIQVCSAIEHAHQQHIVHRDIKPSNVLVTLHGGTALVKVIDFGVAKATHGRLTDETIFTLVDQFIGTPAYVSPEQATLEAAVDARSDIYSLGVLLYELLTGCTPLDPRKLAGETLEEVRRQIREEIPLAPSRRLNVAEAALLSSVAAERRTDVRALVHAIGGDLDWITMQCLEKDRARRYRSVSELAADLTRHLQSVPVLAQPPSLSYAVRKFARRHRAFLATVSVVICALLIATGVSAWQAVRATKAELAAQRERARAEQVSEFLLSVFSAAEPFTHLGKEPTARTLLDQAATKIQNELDQQPAVRAQLLGAIGQSYRLMGAPARAIPLLEESLEIRRHADADDAEVAFVHTDLGFSLREVDRLTEAERHFRDAAVIFSRLNDERSPGYARVLLGLGRLEVTRGNPGGALVHMRQAVRILRELEGQDDLATAEALVDMSEVLIWADQLDEAERVVREALALYESVPADYPDRVYAEYHLANVLLYKGQVDGAADIYVRVLAAQRRLYGPGSTTGVNVLAALAEVRLLQDNIAAAEALLDEALGTAGATASSSSQDIGYLQTMLATVWLRDSKPADAERLLRDVLVGFAADIRPDHQYVASAEHFLGEALLAQGKLSEAEKVLTVALNRWSRENAPRWRAARTANTLGEVLRRLGRVEEAERLLLESYRVLGSEAGADRHSKQLAVDRIRRLYREVGKI